MLARSPELRQFMKEQRGAFSRASKIIRQHFEELRLGGSEFVDKEKKLSIKKASTGSFKGTHNDVTLKVKVENRAFFVKIFDYKDYLDVLRGFRTAESYLRRRKYKVAGLSVKVIKPLLLYEDRLRKKIYLTTDFFEEGKVIQVKDMRKDENKARVIKALDELTREIEHKRNIIEIQPLNAFYNQETNTVLLFDLQYFQY